MCKIARRALALKWSFYASSLALAVLSAWLAGLGPLAAYFAAMAALFGVALWYKDGQRALEDLRKYGCVPGEGRLREAGLAISKRLGREVEVYYCPPDSPLMRDTAAFAAEVGGRAVVVFREAAHLRDELFWLTAWHEAAHIRQRDSLAKNLHKAAFYATVGIAFVLLAAALSPWASAAVIFLVLIAWRGRFLAAAAAGALALAGVAALPTAERMAAFAAAAAAYAAVLKYAEYMEIYADLAAAQEVEPEIILAIVDPLREVYPRLASYLRKCAGEYFKNSSLMASRRASALLGNTPASASRSRASKSPWGRWTVAAILSPLFLGIAAPAPTPRRLARSHLYVNTVNSIF